MLARIVMSLLLIVSCVWIWLGCELYEVHYDTIQSSAYSIHETRAVEWWLGSVSTSVYRHDWSITKVIVLAALTIASILCLDVLVRPRFARWNNVVAAVVLIAALLWLGRAAYAPSFGWEYEQGFTFPALAMLAVWTSIAAVSGASLVRRRLRNPSRG